MLNYQLLSKSPISAISINIINNTSKEFAVPQVSFIERGLLPDAVRGQMSVVDGQQRLTTNYKAYCNHSDLSEDEQINWFEVLNNAGSRVSIIQMRFSKLKAHGIDVYTQYTHIYRNKVLEYGYDYFTPQKANVSYPIAALNPAYEVLISGRHSNNFAPISSDTKENQLCNLEPEQLSECFAVTLQALDKVLKFIDDNRLKKYNRSDYVNYLIGYFVFHREGITDKQKESLINWYNSVNFTNKSNTARRKIYSDLLQI